LRKRGRGVQGRRGGEKGGWRKATVPKKILKLERTDHGDTCRGLEALGSPVTQLLHYLARHIGDMAEQNDF